ncbi:DUF4392 domain-containing protein [Lachnospiraceae bacterium ZAX-1]
MTQKELTKLNIGQNLDDLMNIDPRGYGICRILYAAAREYTGKPLTMNAAEQFVNTVKEGDLVYILTGFVLPAHKEAETDGIISSMFLARALVKAFGAKPVIICQEENMRGVQSLSFVMGLHLYETWEELKKYPISMGVFPFTKEESQAEQMTDELLSHGIPSAVISIEHPGANEKGIYHNAVGLDCTLLEAKTDVLFERLQSLGVLNIAIGDLGNELGMGTIEKQLKTYVPYAGPGMCQCGCGGGIAVRTKADHLITATVSDWGCYGLIAAMAYLMGDRNIFQNEELEVEAMKTAARSGMNDMYGWLIPSIDGMGLRINVAIVNLMRDCIKYPVELEQTCATWFEKVDELGYYDRKK